MKKTILGILYFGISLLQVHAQTDTINLNEVQVTSVRVNLTQPISQNNTQVKELKKTYQGQDIPIILNFSNPSITFTSDGGNWAGYMYYRLRGVDQTRINATLNGVPLNEPEDQGAYFSNYQDFFSNISSMQIQRGVGTSTNGTPSYVGSLNFQSPNLNDTNYTRLDFGLGSFNTNRFSIVTNTGLKNGWGTYMRYSRISSDGYREHSGTLGNTIFTSTGYQDEKQSFKYTMFWGSSKNQMAWLPSNESDIKLNRKNNPLFNDERDDFIQNLNMLSYSRFVNKHISYNITGFYNHLSGSYDNTIFLDSLNREYVMYKYQLLSDFKGVIANVNFNYGKLSGSTGLNNSSYQRQHLAGLAPYYSYNSVDSLGVHNNTGQKNQFSQFIKVSYKIAPGLSIYSDVQYRIARFIYYPVTDQNTKLLTDWKFVNPKFGFNYLKNNKHRVYAFYGTSSREPNRTDIFSSYISNPDPDHLPYETAIKYGWNNIKPENVQDYEFGYDYLSNHHIFSFTGFYMYFKNGLLPIGALNSIGLPINTSVDRSYRRGIEIEYRYQNNGLSFYLGSTIMDSKILSGDSAVKNKQMLLTPNLVINSNLSYTHNKITLMLMNKYVGQSYLNNMNTSDYLKEYIVTNLNLSYTIKKLVVGFNINNLFDQDYYNSGILSGVTRQYFVAAKRNYFLTLNYTF